MEMNALSLLFISTAFACMTTAPAKRSAHWNFLKDRKPAQAMPGDFGGSDQTKWIEETWIANTVTRELQKAYADKEVVDAIVSIPLILDESSYHPYGDGQSNAHSQFGADWAAKSPAHKKEPLAVMRIETTKKGEKRINVTFHPSLGVKNYEKVEKKDFIFVRPQGWQDWFAFTTITQVYDYNEFKKGLPESLKFSDGRTFPDPEKMKPASGSASANFKNHKFGAGYNQEAYPTENTHGMFPDQNGFKTAVGRGMTWVADHGPSPMKHLYTCFEGRKAEQEKAGVITGSGWHKIGDPAETIVNSLENAALLVGLGIDVTEAPPSNGLAFKLNRTASFKLAKPNQVFYSQAGQFHWYANPGTAPFCTEIWVHDCLPNLSNNWGFRCK